MNPKNSGTPITPHTKDDKWDARNTQIAAAATAVPKYMKHFRLCCCFRQNATQKAASVKDAPAIVEQMTVIRLMEV
jgi:hypothetical protein